jgi:hypothetical protein
MVTAMGPDGVGGMTLAVGDRVTFTHPVPVKGMATELAGRVVAVVETREPGQPWIVVVPDGPMHRPVALMPKEVRQPGEEASRKPIHHAGDMPAAE